MKVSANQTADVRVGIRRETFEWLLLDDLHAIKAKILSGNVLKGTAEVFYSHLADFVIEVHLYNLVEFKAFSE